ncbi:MAG: hypothetical protein J4400_01680 [Candidatus Aenigmarchaeota archaeon]|nr:hypothetical protein [Candidatus Aenigmarchaeota archaeon]
MKLQKLKKSTLKPFKDKRKPQPKVKFIIISIIIPIIISSIIVPEVRGVWTSFYDQITGNVPQEKITIVKWYFANSEDEILNFNGKINSSCIGGSKVSDNRCSIVEIPCENKDYPLATPVSNSDSSCTNCSFYTISISNDGKKASHEFNLNLCFDNKILKVVNVGTESFNGEQSTCGSYKNIDLLPSNLFVSSMLIVQDNNSNLKSQEAWDKENLNITKKIIFIKGLVINNCSKYPKVFGYTNNDVIRSTYIEVK